MKPVVDEPLSIKDFDLWVLSKALKEDSEKYQEGLKHLENAKRSVNRFWYLGRWLGNKSSLESVSLLEKALSRRIDYYPPDIQQVFLLTEDELRDKGFTTGYQFEKARIVPNDEKLENDLEDLANPMFGFADGCIDIIPDRKSFSPHYVISAGTGKSFTKDEKGNVVYGIFDPSTPSDICLNHLFYHKVLQVVERAERTENQLKQKIGNFTDKLSERINEYGNLATRTDGVRELYSLSTSNKVAIPWQEAMKQIELKHR